MRVMVLSDGETWTSLRGCKIVDVPEDIAGDDIDIEVRLAAEDAALYTFTGDEPRITAELRATVKRALEGDSNDADHDALFYVAEALHIDFEPSLD